MAVSKPLKNHLTIILRPISVLSGAFMTLKMAEVVIITVVCTLFYIENDVEIFPAHYTWKVAEKWFKMYFMIINLQ
jgi:hypothetical protein